MGLGWTILYNSVKVTARGIFKEIVKRCVLLREYFYIIVLVEIKDLRIYEYLTFSQ